MSNPKKNYTMCDFGECPLAESCARFIPDLDRKNTTHFAKMPFNKEKKKCFWYEYLEMDIDEITGKINDDGIDN